MPVDAGALAATAGAGAAWPKKPSIAVLIASAVVVAPRRRLQVGDVVGVGEEAEFDQHRGEIRRLQHDEAGRALGVAIERRRRRRAARPARAKTCARWRASRAARGRTGCRRRRGRRPSSSPRRRADRRRSRARRCAAPRRRRRGRSRCRRWCRRRCAASRSVSAWIDTNSAASAARPLATRSSSETYWSPTRVMTTR